MGDTWQPHMLPGPVYGWKSQARQYAPTGPPGISYERHYADGEDKGPEAPVDCLLMRDVHGLLVGILNHYPESDPGGLEQAGNVNLWVRADRQRRGIGTRLMREAQNRWQINFEQQKYSPDGIAFVTALLREQT